MCCFAVMSRAVFFVIALPLMRARVNHFSTSVEKQNNFTTRCRILVIIPVRLHEMNLRSHVRTTAGSAKVRRSIQEKGCDLKFRFLIEVPANHTPDLAAEAKQHEDFLSVPMPGAPSRRGEGAALRPRRARHLQHRPQGRPVGGRHGGRRLLPSRGRLGAGRGRTVPGETDQRGRRSDRAPHETRSQSDLSWTRWILSAMRTVLKDRDWDWLLRMDSDAVVCSLNLVQLTRTLSRLLSPDMGMIAGDYHCFNSPLRPNNPDEAFVLLNRASVSFFTESEHFFHPGSPAVMKKTFAMTLASYARLAYHRSFPLIEINLQEVVHIWTETRPDPSKHIFPDSAIQVCSRYIFYHIRTLMKEEALRTHLQDRSLFDPLHSGISGYVPSFRADICEPGMGRTPASDYRGLARDGYNATRYRLAFG